MIDERDLLYKILRLCLKIKLVRSKLQKIFSYDFWIDQLIIFCAVETFSKADFSFLFSLGINTFISKKCATQVTNQVQFNNLSSIKSF